MDDHKMQHPAGGCYNCGGEVRTWEPNGFGWTCAKCVASLTQQAAEAAQIERFAWTRDPEQLAEYIRLSQPNVTPLRTIEVSRS